MAWAAIGGAAVSVVGGKLFGKKGKKGGGGGSFTPHPLTEEAAKTNLNAAKIGFGNAQDLWGRYKALYQPNENKVVSDASNIDSASELARVAGEADANVQSNYDNAKSQNARYMASLGINPNSGRSLTMQKTAELDLAAKRASASNSAVNNAKDKGMAARIAVAGIGHGVLQGANQTNQVSFYGGQSAGSMLNQQGATQAGYITNANRLQAEADAGTGKLLGSVGSAAGTYLKDYFSKK